MLDQRQEGLAVRLLVEGAVAIAPYAEAFDFGRHVEKALGAEKEAHLRTMNPPKTNTAMEIGLRAPRCEREVDRSSLRVEAGGDGDRLEDRRLASAVLADEIR